MSFIEDGPDLYTIVFSQSSTPTQLVVQATSSGAGTGTIRKIEGIKFGSGSSVDLPEWQANIQYSVGDIVIYNNSLYKCITANNDATFDENKWQSIGGSNLNVSTTILLEETSQTLVTGATFTLPENYTNFDEIVLTNGGVSTTIYSNKQSQVQVANYEADTTYSIYLNLKLSGTTATVIYSDYGTYFTSNPTTFYLIGKKFHISSGDAQDFTGATSSSNGQRGLVPAPTTADIDKFLCGDGTWKSAGGSGVNAIVDVLWSGKNTTNASTITLSTNYTNYDVIIGYVSPSSTTGDDVWGSTMINPSVHYTMQITGKGSTSTLEFDIGVVFSGSSATVYHNLNPNTNFALSRIEGIKFINPNVYSTSEHRIGTWIDGKPLYQLIVTLTANVPANTYTEIFDASSLNIDKRIYCGGRLGSAALDNYDGSNFRSLDWPNSSKKVYFTSNNAIDFSSSNNYLELRYTKTTD